MNSTKIELISLVINIAYFVWSIFVFYKENQTKYPPNTGDTYQEKISSDTGNVYDLASQDIPDESSITEINSEKPPSPSQEEPLKE